MINQYCDIQWQPYKSIIINAGDVFKAVSHEATKLSLAYSKPPVPSNEECESLLASVEKTILALLHVYSNLPKCAGNLKNSYIWS
jgi:hypothetical protein